MVRLLADAMVGVTDAGRYDALNEFVGDERRRPAGVVVSTIEEMLLRLHPDIKTQPAASIDQALTATYRQEVITTGQRWARALARTYTFGLCGSRGQQLKGMVGIFLNLRDHELQSVASWR